MAEAAPKLEKTTRDILLDAADHIVASKGVARLTLEEVAREAGVSKGGLLYHFKSKEALTEAMISRFIELFDTAVDQAAHNDADPVGRKTRSYVRATIGDTPLTGGDFDRANGAITAALANFPERLEPVRAQSLRSQARVENDNLDPVFATIIRLAIDGLWLAENFNLMRFDPDLKQAVGERLTAWTKLRALPDADRRGAPKVQKKKQREAEEKT